jgi:hypothetical protein
VPVTFFAATRHLAGRAKLLRLGAEGCSLEPFGGEAAFEKFMDSAARLDIRFLKRKSSKTVSSSPDNIICRRSPRLEPFAMTPLA